MKLLLIACASVAWAIAASGCSTSGGGGPASSPFDPFGIEPGAAGGAEPTVGGDELPPGRSGQTIAQLCSIDCSRIETVCATAAGADCAASCSSAISSAPQCATEFQAYLACISTAPLICDGQTLEAPACDGARQGVNVCASQGAPPSM